MAVEIKLENLVKTIGATTIVNKVSLRVPAGEMTIVLGPSGSTGITGENIYVDCGVNIVGG